MNKNEITITMTANQAKRMNTPELQGEKIRCVMPTKEEVANGRAANVAKDVYFGNHHIGGCMDVND